MTLIEMAKEAGFTEGELAWHDHILERFAALVAEKATEQANARQNASWARMCEKMVVAEREACAKAADDFLTSGRSPLGRYVADAIRARGQK
jgi:hypothetical protein